MTGSNLIRKSYLHKTSTLKPTVSLAAICFDRHLHCPFFLLCPDHVIVEDTVSLVTDCWTVPPKQFHANVASGLPPVIVHVEVCRIVSITAYSLPLVWFKIPGGPSGIS